MKINLRQRMAKTFASIQNTPLLIHPDHLKSISTEIKIRLEQGDVVEDYSQEKPNAEIKQGIAVLKMEGVIVPKGGPCGALFGTCPIEEAKSQLGILAEDPEIGVIILNIDSPGGSVSGVQEFADYVFSLRDKKKIYAVANDLAASAAYWIGSAAHKFYASSKLSVVGSIGVYATHVDISKALEAEGITVTEISSTPLKTMCSENKPLDDQGRAFLQEQVNFIHNAFVNDVARNRGQEASFVKEKMANGLIYFGEAAVSLKFVDGVLTLDELINQSLKGQDSMTIEALNGIKDVETFAKNHPDFFANVVQPSIRTAYEKGRLEGVSQGTQRERTRVKGIDEIISPGFEQLAAQCKADGVTKPEQFAIMQAKVLKEKGHTQPTINPISGGQALPFAGTSGEGSSEKKLILSAMKKGAQSRSKVLAKPNQN